MPNQANVLAFLYAKAGDRETSHPQLQNFLDWHPEDAERYGHLIRDELEKLGLVN